MTVCSCGEHVVKTEVAPQAQKQLGVLYLQLREGKLLKRCEIEVEQISNRKEN